MGNRLSFFIGMFTERNISFEAFHLHPVLMIEFFEGSSNPYSIGLYHGFQSSLSSVKSSTIFHILLMANDKPMIFLML